MPEIGCKYSVQKSYVIKSNLKNMLGQCVFSRPVSSFFFEWKYDKFINISKKFTCNSCCNILIGLIY